MMLYKEVQTLQDCSRRELIDIIQRMVEAFGPPAETFLDLELLRTDLYRMRDAVRDGGEKG